MQNAECRVQNNTSSVTQGRHLLLKEKANIKEKSYDDRPDFMYSYDHIWSYFYRLHSLSLLGFEEEQGKI
jgi:hypothetical protein